MTVDTAIQNMERMPTTWAAGPEVGLSKMSHTLENRGEIVLNVCLFVYTHMS